MNIKTYISILITTIGTNIILLLGGWDKLINTLVILVVIDYATGILKAYKNKNLSSGIGFRGITKKICLFLMIIVAAQFDTLGITQEPVLRTAAILFYISNETLSLIENLTELGVPVPEIIKAKLMNFGDDKNEYYKNKS